MNTALFKACMVRNKDTQAKLAEGMGISLSRLNAKINEASGAEFTQSEIDFCVRRYKLSSDEAMAIFFNQKVS